jgi:hypothetical protein
MIMSAQRPRLDNMPALFDHLYRELCRARLAEMGKQLLISRREVPEATRDESVGFETEHPEEGSDDPPDNARAR